MSSVTVHVVASRPSGLALSIQAQVGNGVRVQVHHRCPSLRTVLTSDLVLVDLSEFPSGVDPSMVHSLLVRARVCLLTGERQVEPGWLEIAHHQAVTVIPVHPNNVSHVSVIRQLIDSQAGRRTTDTVADILVKSEPGLAPLHQLVRAICTQPWSIRHPSHLAVVTGTSLREVKRLCCRAGFLRIEHFITWVRCAACEQFIQSQGLPSVVARELMGITDSSNLRRQLKRAQLGSPRAFGAARPSASRTTVAESAEEDSEYRKLSAG